MFKLFLNIDKNILTNFFKSLWHSLPYFIHLIFKKLILQDNLNINLQVIYLNIILQDIYLKLVLQDIYLNINLQDIYLTTLFKIYA